MRHVHGCRGCRVVGASRGRRTGSALRPVHGNRRLAGAGGVGQLIEEANGPGCAPRAWKSLFGSPGGSRAGTNQEFHACHASGGQAVKRTGGLCRRSGDRAGVGPRRRAGSRAKARTRNLTPACKRLRTRSRTAGGRTRTGRTSRALFASVAAIGGIGSTAPMPGYVAGKPPSVEWAHGPHASSTGGPATCRRDPTLRRDGVPAAAGGRRHHAGRGVRGGRHQRVTRIADRVGGCGRVARGMDRDRHGVRRRSLCARVSQHGPADPGSLPGADRGDASPGAPSPVAGHPGGRGSVAGPRRDRRRARGPGGRRARRGRGSLADPSARAATPVGKRECRIAALVRPLGVGLRRRQTAGLTTPPPALDAGDPGPGGHLSGDVSRRSRRPPPKRWPASLHSDPGRARHWSGSTCPPGLRA